MGMRSVAIRRGLLWLAAAVVWSCSSATDVVENGGDTISAVEVTPPTSTVAVGAQVPLQAVVKDADGKAVTGASVVWTVQDPKIVSVSSSGVVKGLAVGTTQVAANANGKSGIAAITVQKTPVASVVVLPEHVDAVPGVKTPLTGIAYDAAQNALTDRAIIWSSSNDLVATVDANGMVTAVAPGSATITGTAEGKSDVTSVTVTQAPVATVAVIPNPLQMSVSQSTQLTAVARDANGNAVTGRPVTWTSSNTPVATISADGVLTAVTAGTTTITATSEGKSGTSAVTITTFAVGSVAVQPTPTTVFQNGNVQLTAVVRDVTGALTTDRAITWTTSSVAVATVSAAGLVTGVSVGTATITATSEGQSGTATVNVALAPVATVGVNPATASVPVGQTATLSAVIKDAAGNTLTGRTVAWTTSAAAVATVSTSGVVTGVAPGTATITATSEGKSGTAAITVPAIAVGSVAVAPTAPALTVGQTMPLTVTVKNINGTVVTDRVVTWSSSADSIATVSSTGTVSAVNAGSATITATSEGKSGSATATVTKAPVASVSLPATSSVVITRTITLSPTVKDVNGTVVTDRVVTWGSSNNAIATVSTAGVVTGVALGTATITATSEGKSGSTALTVSPIPVGTVTVAPSTPTMTKGQTVTLTATVKDENGTVVTNRALTWSSSATTVATVSQTGVVTGVDAGTATITATSEGKSGTASLTVFALPVGSVTVAPATASVVTGQTATFTATVKDASGAVVTGRLVTWTSGNSAVATVSTSGVATGVTPGSAAITATSEGKTGSGLVTVTKVPVGSVDVAPTTVSLNPGQTSPLTATVKDANGVVVTDRSVAWSTSNGTVASVTQAGVVTANNVGTATITATSETKSGTSAITVALVPVATVTVAPATASVATTQSTTLTATLKDAAGNVLTGRTIAWTSSNPLVATVSAAGVVTGVLPGSVTITATSGGQSGTSAVTVTLLPVATVTVSPSSATVLIGATTQLTATTKDLLGTVLTGRDIAWTSSNSAVATVSSTGLVTGVATGSVTITATSEGKTGTSAITVQAPVATVTVTPASASVKKGNSTQLSAVTKDANGNVLTGRLITWTTSNGSIATVSPTGLVTGVAAGPATITATSEGKKDTSAITVNP